MPAKRAKFRILWLVLERSEVEVCVKDPGYPVDVTCRGKIADFVAVYLGYARWRDMASVTWCGPSLPGSRSTRWSAAIFR